MSFNYTLHNFRKFDTEGISINFKPITMLTGCNSSGKSSITKSLIILESFLKAMTEEFRQSGKMIPENHKIDFTANHLNLGSFSSVVNRASDKKEFSISYTVRPQCALRPYKVELYFTSRNNDFLQSGYLSKIIIKDYRDKIFLSADIKEDRIEPTSIAMDQILTPFLRFAQVSAIYKMKDQISELYIPGYCTDIDLERKLKETIQITNSKISNIYRVEKDYKDFLSRKYKERYPALLKETLLPQLDNLDENHILFYFPLFEEFKNKSKEEQIRLLENAKCEEYLFQIDFYKLKRNTIESFKESECDSFIDYFRSLENDVLHEMICENDQQAVIYDGMEDLYTALKTNFQLSFNENGCLHELMRRTSNKDFETVYNMLSAWQWTISDKDEFITREMSVPMSFYSSKHIVYDALSQYAMLLLECLLNPTFIGELNYIGNFHSEVKRMYTFDDKNSSMVQVLKTYISSRTILKDLNEEMSRYDYGRNNRRAIFKPGTFINKWIKELSLGYGVSIIPDEDNIGAKIFIRKDKTNRKGYSIADEGAGVAQILTFLLYIENAIIDSNIYICRKQLQELEFQEIPAPVKTLILEEPEIGLHPSLQSSLTDIFNDAYQNYNIHFIIETHSEYLIRKSQAIVAKYKTTEQFNDRPFAVHYVTKNGKVYELEYTESGRFDRSFGPGFFDEASRSSIEILKKEGRLK